MRHLDLFSGIGGFALGLNKAGFETVAFCEIEPFCQSVLKKHWPEVPIIEDVRNAELFDSVGDVDIITGGYPCQPFSVAGRQKGADDERHLWPAMFELIKRKRPSWVIGENVGGHVNMGLDEVLSDLENEGYQARAFVIPACAVNALHRRDRVWIVANADSTGWRQGDKEVAREQSEQFDSVHLQSRQIHSDASNDRLQGSAKEPLFRIEYLQGELIRSGETVRIVSDSCQSGVPGITHGFPGRVDRIKSLGNAVVPQIPQIIGEAIMRAENEF